MSFLFRSLKGGGVAFTGNEFFNSFFIFFMFSYLPYSQSQVATVGVAKCDYLVATCDCWGYATEGRKMRL